MAELVRAVTEDKLRSWQDRKAATIEHLDGASQHVLALKAADVCANITDVVLDHREIGDDVWLRFRRGAAKQLWYYTTVAETVLHRLEGYEPLHSELETRVEELRALSR